VDSVVDVEAATSVAEVAEEAATTVIVAQDTAAAAPEAPAPLPDVMTAEDLEVAATTEREAATIINLQLRAEDSMTAFFLCNKEKAALIQSTKREKRIPPVSCMLRSVKMRLFTRKRDERTNYLDNIKSYHYYFPA
jgi:hypothetical protein